MKVEHGNQNKKLTAFATMKKARSNLGD
uniref:Uncharacterized protein n=1 Tax=Rhizophora mucronata TaxID=61149 RepID=A0A2P2PJS3_RHIMU